MLEVITSFFNPCNYQRLQSNYWAFRAALPPTVNLVTVEMAFTGRFQIPDAVHISADPDRNTMWQKERLLNVALEHLSDSTEAVAWVDADILFRNSNWVGDTLAGLERQPIVQMFERVHNLDANGDEADVFTGWAFSQTLDRPTYQAPGGAWAVRREIIEAARFYDSHVLGGGDQVMLAGWNADWGHFVWTRMNKLWRHEALRYAAKIYPLVRGNVGFVPGDITHLFHGSRKNRQYVNRHLRLTRFNFDPVKDIGVDSNGLMAWTTSKERMKRLVANYFAERREDE